MVRPELCSLASRGGAARAQAHAVLTCAHAVLTSAQAPRSANARAARPGRCSPCQVRGAGRRVAVVVLW